MDIRKILNIIEEKSTAIVEGITEKHKTLTIKAGTNNLKGFSYAWVGDGKGNPDDKLKKLFPMVQADSEEEALDLQKQAIDNYFATKTQNTKKVSKIYPNRLLQSHLGLKPPIYTKVGGDKEFYISRDPRDGFIKSMEYEDGHGFGSPIKKTDLENAGFELGTRYKVKQFDTGNPDIIGLKCEEYEKITSSSNKDTGTMPLVVVQWAGRNI